MKKIIFLLSFLIIILPTIVSADGDELFKKYDIAIIIDNLNKKIHVEENISTLELDESLTYTFYLPYGAEHIKQNLYKSTGNLTNNVAFKSNYDYSISYDIISTRNMINYNFRPLSLINNDDISNQMNYGLIYKYLTITITNNDESDVKNIILDEHITDYFYVEKNDKYIMLKKNNEESINNGPIFSVDFNDHTPFVYHNGKTTEETTIDNDFIFFTASVLYFLFHIIIIVILNIYYRHIKKTLVYKVRNKEQNESYKFLEYWYKEKLDVISKHYIDYIVIMYVPVVILLTLLLFILTALIVNIFNSFGLGLFVIELIVYSTILIPLGVIYSGLIVSCHIVKEKYNLNKLIFEGKLESLSNYNVNKISKKHITKYQISTIIKDENGIDVELIGKGVETNLTDYDRPFLIYLDKNNYYIDFNLKKRKRDV